MNLRPALPTLVSTTTLLFSSSSIFSSNNNQVRGFSFLNLTNNKTTQQQSSSSMLVSTNSVLSTIQLDNSWIEQLSSETDENIEKSKRTEGFPTNKVLDNKSRRPIFNGHYVLVKPTGLKNPTLLLVSEDVGTNLLGLSQEQLDSPDFVRYVSGNVALAERSSWATPYALSIMGTRYTNNCPYGTGNGYGDGRAISIGEFNGHELQLKGAGKTPFCRGADGRAVLRSSIREFLASEAMHAMGIGTTRALSLVVSEGGDTVSRPWYTEGSKLQLPTLDDPRLEKYSMEQRRTILSQLRNEKIDPNIMIQEKCAITCRVAPSFVRVGHLDLFARRVEKKKGEKVDDITTTNEYKELVELIWHACYREFRESAYTPFKEKGDLNSAAKALLKGSADKLSTMVAEWIRVGFAQGNFNADNCLIAGNTMDYGPFGFMEEYSPAFAKWTGSGQHFGFMNQPQAGLVNYQVLVESIVPTVMTDGTTVEDVMEEAMPLFRSKVEKVFRRKLGFEDDADGADEIWVNTLQPLLRDNRVDWTLFWRQLYVVAREYDDYTSDNYEAMMTLLEGQDEASPFYETLSEESRSAFVTFIQEWRDALKTTKNTEKIADRMKYANPKYVLREWMMVQAYTNAAKKEDYTELQRLYTLIQSPYDDGSSQQESEYYRRTPDEAYLAGGTAFFS